MNPWTLSGHPASGSSERGTLAPDGGRRITFTHHSATLPRGVDCPARPEGDNREARLGRRGGALQRSGSSGGPSTGGGGLAASRHTLLTHGWGGQSDLGSGGTAAYRITSDAAAGDCQVPLRSWCLPLRDGSAGPEGRRSPRNASLALIQRLGQLPVSVFLDLRRFSRCVRTAHVPLRTRRIAAERARSFRCETLGRQSTSAATWPSPSGGGR
jgi:hypothetical protein